MDLRYAFRMMSRSSGFAAVAVITLALGIGINTIVFTLYGAVALKPIAARAPRELVRVHGEQNVPQDLFSWAQYDQIRTHTRSFVDVLASSEPQTLVARMPQAPADAGEVLHARVVSANYFSALGVIPQVGRGFLPDDRETVILGHEFWSRRFQSDSAVLGKIIVAQGVALRIIGVAPPGFAGTGLPPQMPDVWIPIAAQSAVLPGVDWLRDPNARAMQLLARRQTGAGLPQASAELDVLAAGWPLVDGKPVHLSARAATFFQADSGEFSTFALIAEILMLAVGLILLIGSINLVNLLFARHAARDREFAVRLALGASRFHLVRQLCTESLLLGIAGGLGGLLFSLWACEWVRLAIGRIADRIFGGYLGVFLDISPDWPVFAYTAGVSIVTGIAIGIWPALRASRRDVVSALKQASGTARGGHRGVLIGAQVAACLMLLSGAGLLFHGVWRSSSINPGFDISRVLLVTTDLRTLAATRAAHNGMQRAMLDRLQSSPEIAAVAWADRPPFIGHGSFDTKDDHGGEVNVLFNVVSDHYFDALGIPLLAGRDFTLQEVESGAPVMIVSDLAARRLWPGKNPLGQTVPRDEWLKKDLPREQYTVIGVVKGVRSTYLSKPDEPFLYYPRPLASSYGWFLVRARGPAQSVSRTVMVAAAAIHPNLPARTLAVGLDQAPLQIQRMMAEAPAAVALSLGVLALLLASVGIFGLVSHLVTERTREIAIRVSLGAQIRDVVRMVMRQTLSPVAIGAAVGLAGALGISALLARMVVMAGVPDLTYGAGAFDPATFLGSLAVLTMVVAVASFVPVRRATKIAPADALRAE